MRLSFQQAIVLFSLILFFACSNDDEFTPKPRGYYRIEYPKHSYKEFSPANCPFSFEIPEYSVAISDTNNFAEPCWYYILFPRLNGQIYITYKPLKGDLRSFLEDSRTLVYKHTPRASSIDERLISFNEDVFGVMYDIGGEAASPTQFYVTDSTKHFLRGALYFNASPNSDSIAPSVKFMNEDIMHLLKTLKWK